MPSVDPALPSQEWSLSREGHARCAWLGEALHQHAIGALFASPEPKAGETAILVGAKLGLDVTLYPGLRENDRSDMTFLTATALRVGLADFFANRDQIVFGKESGHMALERFSGALAKLQRQRTGENIAVVAHGAVITLFVTHHNPHVPAMPFWEHLGAPSFVVLEGTNYAFDGKIYNYPG